MTAAPPPVRRLPLATAGPPAEVHPPPFLLPAEHFVAALAWLALGAVGLVVVAPQLAAGNILDPRVFAVTHAITLGVIATAIFGALYQLFPVAMGCAIRSVPVAHLSFWLLQTGIVLVVTGFWYTGGALQGSGWLAITLATGLIGVNLISRGRNTRPDPAVGRYVAGGYAALVAALVLGALRIGETLGHGRVDRLAMIASHFHLAAVGFATSVAIGVGSRMLPMFLVSHGAPRWPLHWAGPVGGVGLTGLVAGQFTRLPLLSRAGAGLLGLALLGYLYLGFRYFRGRLRRALDPGLAHVAAGLVALAAGLGAGAWLLARGPGFEPRVWAVYALLLLAGWLVLLILGVLYKILPFLTWLHLFGPRAGETALPTVSDLTRPSWGWASLALLSGGLAVLVAAVAGGAPAWARAGALGFASGVALVLAQVWRGLRLHPGAGSRAETAAAAGGARSL